MKKSLTTIESKDLVRVIGGAAPPSQPAGGDAPAGAAAQPSIMEELQQLIAIFQDPRIQQLLAGLGNILGAMQPSQTASAAAPPAAAPEKGASPQQAAA